MRWNPGESRPKSEIDGTYGRVGSWRSSRSRRRRGLGTGAADCRAAVASFERRSEKGEREALGWGFIGLGCCVDGRGAGRAGEMAAFLLWATARWLSIREHHHRKQGKERGGARRGRKGKGWWRLTGGARAQ